MQHAIEKDKQMEEEGVTWSNYNRHSVYNIKRLIKTNYGSRFDLLKESVVDHSYRLKYGILLLAKAAGVNKYFEDEDDLFYSIIGFFVFCFVGLVLVMIWESRQLKKKAENVPIKIAQKPMSGKELIDKKNK